MRISRVALFSLMMSHCVIALADDSGDGLLEMDMTGTVIASGCNVDVNSQNQNITIGDFSTGGFTSVGDVQGKAPFSIKLTACDADVTGASVTFSGTADATNGKLLALSDTNGGGAMASGVGIEILDKNSTQIPINTASKYTISGGDNELDFYLSYMATAIPVSEGNASSVMYFDLSYQ